VSAGLVLDTHAWIWWATEDPLLSRKAKREIAAASRVFVPTICLREVAMLAERGRLSFSLEVSEWLAAASCLPRVEMLPLSPEIAATSVQLGSHFHKDPADQCIVASSICKRLPLVTKDQRIRAYPMVRTVW
jgi:PIN domain nuclease of toxin-antitoxin system